VRKGAGLLPCCIVGSVWIGKFLISFSYSHPPPFDSKFVSNIPYGLVGGSGGVEGVFCASINWYGTDRDGLYHLIWPTVPAEKSQETMAPQTPCSFLAGPDPPPLWVAWFTEDRKKRDGLLYLRLRCKL